MNIKANWANIKHKKVWFDSMVGMTWGFIASLIVGTIIGLFGIHQTNNFHNFVTDIKSVMSFVTGLAIGIGIGIKTGRKPLQILAIGLAAQIVAQSTLIPHFINGIDWNSAKVGINTKLGLPGDVFAAWLSGVALVYFFSVFQWQFFLDILIVPILGVALGIFGSLWLTYLTSSILVLLEWIIEHSVNKYHWAAILLAPIIGVLMGLALSLPTSSAAIAFALSLHGDAAMAAIAGTSAQMLTFGVMTYLATGKVGQSIAVAFGTSMLQMNNFIRRPILLLLPCIISGLAAIIAVAAIQIPFSSAKSATSGMGTCAFYGQIFTLEENGWGSGKAWVTTLILELAIPIALATPAAWFIINKKEWIKKDWLQLVHD